MSRKNAYPLRLDGEVWDRLEEDANKKKWTLKTWLTEAVLLMLSIEEAKEGRL